MERNKPDVINQENKFKKETDDGYFYVSFLPSSLVSFFLFS